MKIRLFNIASALLLTGFAAYAGTAVAAFPDDSELCDPTGFGCMSDIPVIGEPIQGAFDTVYLAVTEGGVPTVPPEGVPPEGIPPEGVPPEELPPVELPPGGSPPPTSTGDYGDGVIGTIAELMSNLNAALIALLNGDSAGAGALLQLAVSNLGTNITDLITGTDNSVATTLAEAAGDPNSLPANLGDLIGLDSDPLSVAQRAAGTAREVEPVVVSGAAIPNWSVPAAVGLANPYPIGGNSYTDQTRSIHNGTLIYPATPALAVPGVPVNEIAAYRYAPNDNDADSKGFVEIPVQIDERMPYYLANARSDFAFYSGTDPELNYVWDLERWDPADSADGCNAVPPVGTPDPVPGLDNDDEVVFMAKDAGAQAPASIVPDNAQLNADGQEILVADPLDAATVSFVYLFRKTGGSTFRNQSVYVNYTRDTNADQWIDRTFYADNDPQKIGTSNTGYGPNLPGNVCHPTLGNRNSTDRFPRDGLTVSTDSYRWYATGRWMLRDIRIKDPTFTGTPDAAYWATRPDLIDRWKGRAFQQSPDATVSVVGFEDEQVNWEANSALIGERKGPVRAIREVWGADSGTNVTKTETFYRDAITYRYHVRVHPIPPDGLYTDWDYNRNAMVSTDPNVPGGRYFSILRPQGVLIDGINDDAGNIDSLANAPAFFDVPDPTFNLTLGFQNWEQVSGKGNFGSLVYIFEMTGATSLANPLVVPYYRDDACLDDGTGDDPVQRPYPGETTTDSRVKAGYVAAAGGTTPYEQLRCDQKQGAHGQHGVHYFFTHDTDNATLPVATTEIDGMQWQFMVPTAAPTNIAEPYANVVRAPLKTVVTPRPAQVAAGGGDADADGVADGSDACPNTPAGQAVNGSGCADSQLDTDSDGVSNGSDNCPTVANTNQANEDGDALGDACDTQDNRDSDGDGIQNHADTCANTPAGETANANGCSVSQRDTDGDGVNDAVDQCLNEAGPASNNGCPVPTDTTPNAFSFTSVSGVNPNTTVSSNVVTINGIDAPSPISVTSGEYRINGGAYTSAAGTISNGQTVQVRHTSAATANSVTETVLTIGGVIGKFRSTTAAGGTDTDPDAFSFITQTGVAQSSPITSNTITPVNYTAPTTVKAGAGTVYSIGCTGSFTAAQGMISPTQTICVQHASASTANTLKKTSLQIGTTVGYFSTRTAP